MKAIFTQRNSLLFLFLLFLSGCAAHNASLVDLRMDQIGVPEEEVFIFPIYVQDTDVSCYIPSGNLLGGSIMKKTMVKLTYNVEDVNAFYNSLLKTIESNKLFRALTVKNTKDDSYRYILRIALMKVISRMGPADYIMEATYALSDREGNVYLSNRFATYTSESRIAAAKNISHEAIMFNILNDVLGFLKGQQKQPLVSHKEVQIFPSVNDALKPLFKKRAWNERRSQRGECPLIRTRGIKEDYLFEDVVLYCPNEDLYDDDKWIQFWEKLVVSENFDWGKIQ